jgi:hypothetical protein
MARIAAAEVIEAGETPTGVRCTLDAMVLRVSWARALAWRMGRHYLETPADAPPEEVVRRLGAVQAQVASSAELAVRLRLAKSGEGDVASALADGRLIKTWAMRGTLHLLTPEEGPGFLSVIASGRSWERPSWIRYFKMTPLEMERLRGAVREVLDGRVLTREELIADVVARPGLEHAGEALRSGWGTLLKPLAWQGDLCFGPNRGTRVTFQRPERASARWNGLPAVGEAAPEAIAMYLRAYGPAPVGAFGAWLAGGWFGTKQMKAWFGELGDRVTDVEVDGDRCVALAEDVDELAAARPTSTVRLVPGFDQYVLGPGTADARILAPERRSAVSRAAGWIAPTVVAGGVIAGTWELEGGEVRVDWFPERGRVPRTALQGEVERLGTIVGRSLTLSIRGNP